MSRRALACSRPWAWEHPAWPVDSGRTPGILPYRRGIFPPSACRAHPVTVCKRLMRWRLLEVRAAPPECEGGKIPAPSDIIPNVLLDTLRPADLAEPPEVAAHLGAPRSLACCAGATAATFVSNRADARALAARPARLSSRRLPPGIARRHHARSRRAAARASRRGCVGATSHSPRALRRRP